MTKKDYVKAAEITKSYREFAVSVQRAGQVTASAAAQADAVEAAFVALFRNDNPAFDVERFRAACRAGTLKLRSAS